MAMERGMHLLVDGALATRPQKAQLSQSLLKFILALDLTLIGGPFVFDEPDAVYGLVLVAESHISCHWTGGLLFADLFSCKAFSVEKVLPLVVAELGLTEGEYSHRIINRGWGFIPQEQ